MTDPAADPPRRFLDRTDAGRRLAEALDALGPFADPIVLALPRGGVPVGAEVAERLDAPLDVFVARKLGAPRQPELAIGAIAEGSDGIVTSRDDALDPGALEALAAPEREELQRRVERYRGGRPLPSLEGRDVILVDDGIATGLTAEAALRAIARRHPRRLIFGVPVAPPESVERLGSLAEIVCLLTPPRLVAVGLWYERFDQLTDDEVAGLLSR